MNTKAKLFLAAAAVLAIAPLAGAQAPPQGPPAGGEARPGWQMPDGPQGRMRMGPQGGPGMGQRMGMRRGMWMRMGRGMGMGWGPRMGRQIPLGLIARNPALRERLGLTAEQVNKIRTQSSAFTAQTIRGRADLQVKRLELADLLAADNPDRAAIDKKLREVNDARFADERAGIEHRLAMRDVLTAEQRTKLGDMRREMFNRRMGPHPGPEGIPGQGMQPRGPRPQGDRPSQPPAGKRPPDADNSAN